MRPGGGPDSPGKSPAVFTMGGARNRARGAGGVWRRPPMRGASRVYILATHIPIYTSGGRNYLSNSWFRDVLLARDWLAAPFAGRRVLIAPSEPATDELGQLGLVDPSLGIKAVSGMDNRCRARTFWLASENAGLPRSRATSPVPRFCTRPSLTFSAQCNSWHLRPLTEVDDVAYRCEKCGAEVLRSVPCAL